MTASDKTKTYIDALIAGTVIILTGIFIVPHLWPGMEIVGFVIWVIVWAVFVIVRWSARVTIFLCPVCHHEFQASAVTIAVTPHYFGSKYICCPECGKRNWIRMVRKEDPF
jgi:hypothetical protein